MTAKASSARTASVRSASPVRRKAALSMYDLPELHEANDALWAAIAARLRARNILDVPDQLTRDMPPEVLWIDPELILAQTCGLPLATGLERQVQVVASRAIAPEAAMASIIAARSSCAPIIQPVRWMSCGAGAARSMTWAPTAA